MFDHKTEQFAKRCDAFGFDTVVVDGHDVCALEKAIGEARDTRKGKPHAIIAKTFKGKNFKGMEDKLGFHGKPLGGAAEEILKDLEALIVNKDLLKGDAPPVAVNSETEEMKGYAKEEVCVGPLSYKKGELVATRNGFGNGLKAIGKDKRVVSVDADVHNSTMTIYFAKEYPDRHIQGFIAE